MKLLKLTNNDGRELQVDIDKVVGLINTDEIDHAMGWQCVVCMIDNTTFIVLETLTEVAERMQLMLDGVT
jgi:hypothetical protein